MKALLKEAAGPGFSYTDVPEPQIAHPDDVLIDVAYCAVAIDEVKLYVWNQAAATDPLLRLPTVIGREAAGVVAAVGGAVTSLQPGDRAAIDPIIHCGRCRQCHKGRHNLCVEREIYGKQRGAFAERALLPERALCRLPDRVSLQEGTLLADLGVAVHAVEMAQYDPGDWACIMGATTLGLLAAQVLTAWGVNVVVADVVEGRLEIARQAPQITVVNARQDEPRRVLADLSGGTGAAVVLETLATQTALDEAFATVAHGGTVITTSVFNQPVTFNPYTELTRREVRLLSATGRTRQTWLRMVQLIEAGKVNLSWLIGDTLPISDYAMGFEMAAAAAPLKILLRPSEEAR